MEPLQRLTLIACIFASAALLTSAASDQPYCSGHGQLSCNCTRGYEGPNCDTPINWCEEPLRPYADGRHSGAICRPHGHCVSEPSTGASCICLPGWTGPNCETPIANKALDTRRCALYNTPMVHAANVTVGCPIGQRCLSDHLNCGYQHCKNPVGWCLPAVAEQSIMDAWVKSNSHGGKGEQLMVNSDTARATHCVNGAPSCECEHGYTGARCETPIDFCNVSASELSGGHQVGEVCGSFGHCNSSTAGAFCECEPGWSGPFCTRPIHGQRDVASRCVLDATSQTTAKGWTTIGCPAGQRCLTDRLNCGFQPCAYPIGWCLPKPTADKIMKMHVRSNLKQ